MSDLRIYRVYPNGEWKNETHVLQPHISDGEQCTGYDGDVDAWSKHNQLWRFGNAQIVHENDEYKCIYSGSCSEDVINEAIAKFKELHL